MNTFADLLGLILATVLTLLIFARLWGAVRVFYPVAYLLLGLLAGYVAVVSLRRVLIPGLLLPLQQAQAWPTLLLPLGLLVLLLLRMSRQPRLYHLGLPAVGWLAGAMAGLALAGAVRGTLLPQMLAVIVLTPTEGRHPGLDPVLTLLSAFLTLAVLTQAWHRQETNPTLRTWLTVPARIGKLALMAAAGVFLGSLLTARLALPIDRVYELVEAWSRMIGGGNFFISF